MQCVPWHRCLVCGLTAITLWQAPSASALITGTSTDNLDGTFTYSYRIDNSAGLFEISAWSLEFAFLTPDWNQLDAFSGGSVAVPNRNWFADAGIPIAGLSAQDFLSLDPSADVLVGGVLAGFSFTSTFAPGLIRYYEFSATGDSATGDTVGPTGPAVRVPDAGGGTSLLGLIGLISLVGLSAKGVRVSAG